MSWGGCPPLLVILPSHQQLFISSCELAGNSLSVTRFLRPLSLEQGAQKSESASAQEHTKAQSWSLVYEDFQLLAEELGDF